jgi:tetratricopeptide (TPR) repeat protein
VRKLSWAVVLLLFSALPARAADPNTPRIGPEEGPQAKVERVLRALGQDGEAWRAKVAKGEVLTRDVVHRMLLEKDAAYKRAVESFDRDGCNAEDFEKIVAGATDAVLKAHATYFLGRAYLNLDDYDKAIACFEKVRGELANATSWTDEAAFYLGYAFARKPELEEDRDALCKARAKAALEQLPASAPERVQENAKWLLRELNGEGSGPLLELARRMETIERSIDHERTGRPTQKRQEAVISEIDRLIALMRQKEGGG